MSRAFVAVALLLAAAGGCGRNGDPGNAGRKGSAPPAQTEFVASLSRLESVASVATPVEAAAPGPTIVHTLDWHLVDREAFATDLRETTDVPLDDPDIARPYKEHVDDVERVQADARAVLAWIAGTRGITAALQEGLTEADMPAYGAKLAVLRDAEEQLREASADRETIAGAAPELDAAIDGLRQWRRLELLRIGASGQLLMEGVLKAVVPLEDEASYEAANPIRADVTFVVDEAANEAREDAHVRRALQHGPCAVIVLGGAHDLADNVRRIAPEGCAYIRVTTRTYQRIADGR